jgi:kynurenine formamidase
MYVVDLTQPLGPATVVWPGSPAPVFEVADSYERDGSFSRVVTFSEHSGTHLDAPAHFAAGTETIDQIPAERLVCQLAVIDIRDRTAENSDYRLCVADIESDERRQGPIAPGAAVAILTGWGERSSDRRTYLGHDDDGAMHFPGVGRDAAEWLTTQRRIVGIGIDTAGIDAGVDTAFEVHSEVTLPRGVWHLEGLVNLERLPARGATVFVGAIPFIGGSGAPARVIAVVSDPA